MTAHDPLALVGLATVGPLTAGLGVAYIRQALRAPSDDTGRAALVLVSVLAVLAVLALLVAPAVAELRDNVRTITVERTNPQ